MSNGPLMTGRISVEFHQLEGSPGVFYLFLRFREGWQTGHFRMAAQQCWAIIQARVPEGQRCYSIFLMETGSRLQQAGLLGEVTRSIRHPAFSRIAMTYVVGLDEVSAAVGTRLATLAAWVAAREAPFAICAALDEALAEMREHANRLSR
jgi:hypothetical protein